MSATIADPTTPSPGPVSQSRPAHRSATTTA
jgi:hypothetical protein